MAVVCVATFNVTLILDGLVLTFKRFPSLLYNVTSGVFVTVLLTPFKSTYALADEILSISSFVPTTSTVSGLRLDFSRVAPLASDPHLIISDLHEHIFSPFHEE